MQLDKIKESESDLLEILSNDRCDKIRSLQLLAQFSKQSQAEPSAIQCNLFLKIIQNPFLRNVLDKLSQRFPQDRDLIVYLARLVSEDGATETTDAFVLRLIPSNSIPSLVDFEDARSEIFSLLWNRGVDHFQRKSYPQAVAFFERAYAFGAAEQLMKTSRAVALCFIGFKDYTRYDFRTTCVTFKNRAAEWMSLCFSLSSGKLEVVDCFIKFKIALLQLDDDAAEESFNQMFICSDFSPEVLKV